MRLFREDDKIFSTFWLWVGPILKLHPLPPGKTDTHAPVWMQNTKQLLNSVLVGYKELLRPRFVLFAEAEGWGR